MHNQQLQCVSVFSEVNAWKPQILPNAPKMFLFLAWFPKGTRHMQPYWPFVCQEVLLWGMSNKVGRRVRISEALRFLK